MKQGKKNAHFIVAVVETSQAIHSDINSLEKLTKQ